MKEIPAKVVMIIKPPMLGLQFVNKSCELKPNRSTTLGSKSLAIDQLQVATEKLFGNMCKTAS